MSEEKNGGTPPANKTTDEVEDKQEKQKSPSFSWLEPHPIFVIVLVGPEEQPFGIQKDFLCDRSEFFEKQFAESRGDDRVERVVRLPETNTTVFGLAQNYLFTNSIISDTSNVPSYEALVGLWNLGHKLGIRGLCEKTLDAMRECRRITQRIPATPLLVQVWKDTPEGSSIRQLLLSWTAEYMRSSDARAEFAKSLPQEVLSELVVAMSSIEVVPPPPVDITVNVNTGTTPRKNVHYLEDESEDDGLKSKKNRRSLGTPGGPQPSADQKLLNKAKLPRPSLSKPVPKRRSSAGYVDSRSFTTSQKLDFCADLLARMLSGPGFWTRLVGPFREPVEPVEDGVPDYFDKVKRPMDLSTIKVKMDRKEYTDDEEFLADMRQIFDNCFTYWKKGDPMWLAGEKLQKTFEDKFSNMNKWITKMGGEEVE